MKVKKVIVKASLCALAGLASTSLAACKSEAAVKDSHEFTEPDAIEDTIVTKPEDSAEDPVIMEPTTDDPATREETADEPEQQPADPAEDSAKIPADEPDTEPDTEANSVEEPAPEEDKLSIDDTKATYYTTAKVNVRELPVDGEVLGSLAKDKKVTVTGKVVDKNWYRISYEDSAAFVSGKYLTKTKPVEKPVEVAKNDPVKAPAEKPVDKDTSKDTGKNTSKDTSKDNNKKPAEKPSKDDNKKSAEKPNKDTSKNNTSGSKNYQAWKDGTPINKLDFSGLSKEEGLDIISSVAADGGFSPKKNSGYVWDGNVSINSKGKVSIDVPVQTDPNNPDNPGVGTEWEGTSFTGNTHMEGDAKTGLSKGSGVVDNSYTNPTQSLKDGTTFKDFIHSWDYDQSRDNYPRVLAEFYVQLLVEATLK